MKDLKRILFFLVVFFLSSYQSKAQDYNQLINDFQEAYKQENITLMESKSQDLIYYYTDNYAGYALMTFVKLLKKDLASSERHLNTAMNLAPYDSSMYSIASLYHLARNNTTEAQKWMEFAFQIRNNDGFKEELVKDLKMLNKFSGVQVSDMISRVDSYQNKYPNSIALVQKMGQCFEKWNSGANCSEYQPTVNTMSGYNPKNNLGISALNYYKANGIYYSVDYHQGIGLLKDFVTKNAGVSYLNFLRANAYLYLSTHEDSQYNNETAYLYEKKGLDELGSISHLTYLKVMLLNRKMLCEGNLKLDSQKIQTAQQLLSLAKELGNTEFQVQALNSIGVNYIMSTNPNDFKTANTNLEKAYNLALSTGDERIISIVAPNYSLVLYRQKQYSKAVQVANRSIQYRIANKEYSAAQVEYNNLGYLMYYEKRYSEAIELFKKAVAITEDYKKHFSASQFLVMMNEHSSAYEGLVLCYQKTNNSSALFEVQEKSRGRILKEKLNLNTGFMTLSKAQSLLADNEILLYYSLGQPGEVIINVITKNNSRIAHNYPIDSWLQFKSNYLNRISKQPQYLNGYKASVEEEIIDGQLLVYASKENAFQKKHLDQTLSLTREILQTSDSQYKQIQTAFLKQWYDFLIAPVQSDLSGKNKIIISGEGVLNYLPFESLIDKSGKYLVEKHDISYIPSATIWSSLKSRNYTNTRKSVIAMGGATYKQSAGSSPVRGLEQFYELQTAITEKLSKGNHLKTEFAKLGFGSANYLPGTLQEVQNIGKIVPDAVILTDQQMKESEIKKLDKSGKLSEFKVVHIATHGFALESIPELSGIMMTTPASGDGNEDGFLIAPEIAKMTLKADLAIMSACDTGLGKLYKGEGINGLNSALLVAGANGTLLSLWPVNDAGTMMLMTLVYNYVFKDGMSPEKALNQAKRYMISGKAGAGYASPVIWAPFVYNGR